MRKKVGWQLPGMELIESAHTLPSTRRTYACPDASARPRTTGNSRSAPDRHQPEAVGSLWRAVVHQTNAPHILLPRRAEALVYWYAR